MNKPSEPLRALLGSPLTGFAGAAAHSPAIGASSLGHWAANVGLPSAPATPAKPKEPRRAPVRRSGRSTSTSGAAAASYSVGPGLANAPRSPFEPVLAGVPDVRYRR